MKNNNNKIYKKTLSLIWVTREETNKQKKSNKKFEAIKKNLKKMRKKNPITKKMHKMR